MQMLGNKVLVKQSAAMEQTKSGLFLPPVAQKENMEGIVIAVGPGTILDNGTIAPMTVKTGDKILFVKHGFHSVKNPEDEELLIMNEENILCILE